MHPILRQAIVDYRRNMPIGRKQASYNSKFSWKYPRRAEQSIESFASNLFKQVVGPLVLFLKNNIPDYEKNRGVVRIDATNQEILDEFSKYDSIIDLTVDKVEDSEIDELVFIITALLTAEWYRFTEKYAGVAVPIFADFELAIPEIRNNLRNFIKEELHLFMKSTKELLGNDLAVKAVYQKTYTKIFEKFKRLVITRSKYIARNLVSNAQSKLSQLLFTAAGFPNYIWNVNMDEVLRGNPSGKYANKIPSHFVMSGIICQWSNDGTYSVDGKTWQPRTALMEFKKPGVATNCRCYASVYIVNDLKNIDNTK